MTENSPAQTIVEISGFAWGQLCELTAPVGDFIGVEGDMKCYKIEHFIFSDIYLFKESVVPERC